MNYEYDNIMALAKKHNLKKIMIIRNSWSNGNWCIVNKVIFKPDGKYGFAYGHIHYKDGNKTNGEISCAGSPLLFVGGFFACRVFYEGRVKVITRE